MHQSMYTYLHNDFSCSTHHYHSFLIIRNTTVNVSVIISMVIMKRIFPGWEARHAIGLVSNDHKSRLLLFMHRERAIIPTWDGRRERVRKIHGKRKGRRKGVGLSTIGSKACLLFYSAILKTLAHYSFSSCQVSACYAHTRRYFSPTNA